MLSNDIHYYMSPKHRELVEVTGKLQSSNLTGIYVGPLASPAKTTPPGILFHTLPASEGIALPFCESGDSQTLDAVEPGGQLSRLTVNLHDLFSRALSREESTDMLRLYFLTAIPTQFGPTYATRVHSHVVLCPPQYFDWCDAHLHRLSVAENRLLRFGDNGGALNMLFPVKQTISFLPLCSLGKHKMKSHFFVCVIFQ